MYIHEQQNWPSFLWNKEVVGQKLNEVCKAVGFYKSIQIYLCSIMIK